MKIPPHHSLIETEDGSFTLFNEKFEEGCHSTHGAKAETLLHYIEGCEITSQINKFPETFTILEVGFGLGIGFETTLEIIGREKSFNFYSLEFDLELLDWYREKSKIGLEWKERKGIKTLEVKSSNFELVIFADDARKSIHTIESKCIHAIYQDAFSPKKNPRLWSVEWFEELKRVSHPDVKLSTYSSSASIQKSLLEAGFHLKAGASFGKKRSSTRAILSGENDIMILEKLKRSPVAAIRDKDLS